uniref:Uncharacterized protein n=1 Tax=Knipowitschia caucasica TaxID=637954 RepID=A0AAV2KAU5_KNICA
MEVRDMTDAADGMEVRDTADAAPSKKTFMGKIFKVRKRREKLFVQVCFVCSVLFVAWSMSVVLSKTVTFPWETDSGAWPCVDAAVCADGLGTFFDSGANERELRGAAGKGRGRG